MGHSYSIFWLLKCDVFPQKGDFSWKLLVILVLKHLPSKKQQFTSYIAITWLFDDYTSFLKITGVWLFARLLHTSLKQVCQRHECHSHTSVKCIFEYECLIYKIHECHEHVCHLHMCTLHTLHWHLCKMHLCKNVPHVFVLALSYTIVICNSKLC